MIDRVLTDAELWAIPPHGTANPFRNATDNPIGQKNADRWADLHYSHGGRGQDASDVPKVVADPMEALLDRMDEIDGQKLFYAPKECGGKLVLPIEAPMEAFEQRLRDFHAKSATISMPTKPGSHGPHILTRGD